LPSQKYITFLNDLK